MRTPVTTATLKKPIKKSSPPCGLPRTNRCLCKTSPKTLNSNCYWMSLARPLDVIVQYSPNEGNG